MWRVSSKEGRNNVSLICLIQQTSRTAAPTGSAPPPTTRRYRSGAAPTWERSGWTRTCPTRTAPPSLSTSSGTLPTEVRFQCYIRYNIHYLTLSFTPRVGLFRKRRDDGKIWFTSIFIFVLPSDFQINTLFSFLIGISKFLYHHLVQPYRAYKLPRSN